MLIIKIDQDFVPDYRLISQFSRARACGLTFWHDFEPVLMFFLPSTKTLRLKFQNFHNCMQILERKLLPQFNNVISGTVYNLEIGRVK